MNDKIIHRYDVEVGRDKIEDVEYFRVCDSVEELLSLNDNKRKTFTQKLKYIWESIFIWLPHRFKMSIKDIYYEIRYGFERMFKGYDSVDCFETFCKFTERYEKILKQYRKHHHGYPTEFTPEQWEQVVDDMIYHLYYMQEQNVEEELTKDMSEGFIPNPTITYKIMEKHKNEFFELFSKHFYNLWD